MSDMTCPHCRGDVPRGATVCRGCAAEIEYGAPKWAYFVALIVGVFVGAKVYGWLPESLHWMAWVVGGVAFLFAVVGVNKLFVNRVNFERIYRTR